jgi:hypothetical protein
MNTFKVTADESEQKGVSASGGAAVIIGSPPTSCFEFDDTWNSIPSGKAQVLGAIADLSGASVYVSTLCGAGQTIKLSYSGQNTGYAAEVRGNEILFHVYGLSYGSSGTLYTLAHETGHIYAARTDKDQQFYDNAAVAQEGFICTYLLTKTPPEDFAETIGIYVAKKSNTNNTCLGNFKTQYPNHWKFARENIFYQDLGW